MRNGYKPWSIASFVTLTALCLVVGLVVGFVVGCAPKKPRESVAAPVAQQAVLDAGFAALEGQQYNEAITKADEFLKLSPQGAGSPEALYLKGRALEGKNLAAEVTPEQVHQNLSEAKTAYVQALDRVSREPLQSYIRTSLANVAYFQNDYPTAISQWTAAYDKLDRDDLKAWALYRVGVSQQRIGQFAQADQTFANVQQFHAGSVPAQRAQEHQGARAFFVQLATFASPTAAQNAIVDLKKKGINASRVSNAEGHSLLRVGPLASYNQAIYFKNQLAAQYPDAIVLP